MAPDHLVGVTEIGELLGVSRQRASQIANTYTDFPAPEAELAAGRVWLRAAVEAWIAMHPVRTVGRAEGVAMMFERYTDRARTVFVLAQREARALSHTYLGCEHFVVGLLVEGTGIGGRALSTLGLSADDARKILEQLVGPGKKAPGVLAFTPRVKQALGLAQVIALDLGHNYIGTEHLLLGILREGDNVGCRLLIEAGLDLDALRHQVLELMKFPQPRVEMAVADERQFEQVSAQLDAIAERGLGGDQSAVVRMIIERLDRIEATLKERLA
jgi:ATP-dependent Clp protease ATP-binding subunit ClpC